MAAAAGKVFAGLLKGATPELGKFLSGQVAKGVASGVATSVVDNVAGETLSNWGSDILNGDNPSSTAPTGDDPFNPGMGSCPNGVCPLPGASGGIPGATCSNPDPDCYQQCNAKGEALDYNCALMNKQWEAYMGKLGCRKTKCATPSQKKSCGYKVPPVKKTRTTAYVRRPITRAVTVRPARKTGCGCRG